MAEPSPHPLWTTSGGWSPPAWVDVVGRLTAARHYWISTASSDAVPHTTPVEGLWWEGRLWIGHIAGTRRSSNLLANQAVTAHLTDAESVVIVRGTAELCDLMATKRALAATSTEKYGLAFPPERAEWFEIRPTEVLTWEESELAQTGTRWTW